jgi:hypothetical protein
LFVEWAGSLGIAEPLRRVVEDKANQVIYEPWQITFYLGTGMIARILVSAVTPAVAPARLNRFYARTRTPIQLDETLDEPYTLPKGFNLSYAITGERYDS